MGPGNRILDGGPDPPCKGGNFEGEGWPIVKYGPSAVSCAKTAELIEIPFEVWTRVGPRKHALDGGALWPNLAIGLASIT